ncbi:hypothetical protein [Flavilitoribacter nigricans]|uniref:Cyclase n=1 Tax=Flavilitoribacter nigricans (strain ATCC 23147 / DSM 23189 / NBRC 102662 / NCIMB 1420 / SS-2) TaxID=1122177 RepID=A0A2D0N020_FLAN2|nr:hypothetical protein [Flavilitoribacter nigricans]PHN01817.1 hypothetical protein CRP01_34830 [Flavilitoribacter nigricans DSM 23189 = NBRC 102662]
MITLRIEHKVSDYDGWKKAFDNDPINRKKSGVKRYRIYRPTDDENYVIIELDFDNIEQAHSTQIALHKLFGMIEGKLVFGGKTKILTMIEITES